MQEIWLNDAIIENEIFVDMIHEVALYLMCNMK